MRAVRVACFCSARRPRACDVARTRPVRSIRRRELQRWRLRRVVQVERHRDLVIRREESRHERLRVDNDRGRHVGQHVHVHGELRRVVRREQRHRAKGLVAARGECVGGSRAGRERLVHEPRGVQLHGGRWSIGGRVVHVGHLQRPRRRRGGGHRVVHRQRGQHGIGHADDQVRRDAAHRPAASRRGRRTRTGGTTTRSTWRTGATTQRRA